MSGTYEDERMRKCAIALIALLALAGCQTAPEKAKQKEVERVLNRTITETQVQKVEVPVYVNLPAYLLAPCTVDHGKDRTVNTYISLAISNTANAQKCANQIEGIRKLQPDQSSLPQK